MKVLRQGNVNDRPMEGRCQHCGCKVECTRSETVETPVYMETDEAGFPTSTLWIPVIACPECGTDIRVE